MTLRFSESDTGTVHLHDGRTMSAMCGTSEDVSPSEFHSDRQAAEVLLGDDGYASDDLCSSCRQKAMDEHSVEMDSLWAKADEYNANEGDQ